MDGVRVGESYPYSWAGRLLGFEVVDVGGDVGPCEWW